MTAQPSKIVCVGRSYAAHAKELGNAVPTQPVLFIKPPSSLASLAQGVRWNTALGSCHYECELVIQIKTPLSQVTDPTLALAAIGGVTLGLDLTLRDVQTAMKTQGQPWERAKAYDGSCILGEWVAPQLLPHWDQIHFQFKVNGETRQQGDTALLLFSIAELICDISQAFTLNEGDVIMTGTPAGVGALQYGDQLDMILFGQEQTFTWQTHVA